MISIITPVFGKSQITSEFIQGIAPYMKDDDELIIVDNNSPDNTLAVLGIAKKSFPINIQILSNSKNLGFGTANNLGASLAKNNKLLFISNDVKVVGDILSTVILALDANPRDAIGPRLIDINTGWNTFNEVGVIPYLEGFCFAMRKEVFNMVGGFDENIFIDMEDLDLCFRLHLAGIGLRSVALPVMHELGGSFSSLPSPRLDYTLQSQAYFLKKWGFTKRG